MTPSKFVRSGQCTRTARRLSPIGVPNDIDTSVPSSDELVTVHRSASAWMIFQPSPPESRARVPPIVAAARPEVADDDDEHRVRGARA